jgi:O-antigen/teichoic acid export membrane protein
MAAIYLRIDMVMLKHLGSTADVGIYAVAARLSEAWFFVPVAIATSFFPSLLEVRSTSPSEYYRRLQAICDGLFVLGFVVAVVVTLLARPGIRLLYGSAFDDAGPILALHVWGGTFIAMRALLSKWLIVEELYRFSLLSQGLGAVVNVALNFAMIPEYGAIGAAVSTVVSYAVASYFVLFISRRTRLMAWIMTKSMLMLVGGYFFRRQAGAEHNR